MSPQVLGPGATWWPSRAVPVWAHVGGTPQRGGSPAAHRPGRGALVGVGVGGSPRGHPSLGGSRSRGGVSPPRSLTWVWSPRDAGTGGPVGPPRNWGTQLGDRWGTGGNLPGPAATVGRRSTTSADLGGGRRAATSRSGGDTWWRFGQVGDTRPPVRRARPGVTSPPTEGHSHDRALAADPTLDVDRRYGATTRGVTRSAARTVLDPDPQRRGEDAWPPGCPG